MYSLELVLLLLVEIAHLGEDLRVARHFRDQDVVPLEGFTSHSDQLVHMRNLIKHLVAVGDNRVELLESLQGLVVVAEALVDETEVVNSLNAVSFDTDGLKEKLLSAVKLLVHEQRVALVDQRLRVVAVVLDSEVSEVLSVLEVILEEVEERNVVGGHRHHDLVLLFESLEALNSLLNLLVLDKMDCFGNFHLGLDLGQVCSLQRLDDVVVASEDILLDEGRH